MSRRPVESGFVREGRFLALPVAVPGECDPLDPDCSRLRRLAIAPLGGAVYAATGGSACHIVQGQLLGAAGLVLDLGAIPGATAIAGVAVWSAADEEPADRLLVAAQETAGSRLWLGTALRHGDTMQEPGFAYPDWRVVGELPGRAVRDVLADGDGAVLLCDNGLARWSAQGIAWLAEAADPLPRLVRLGSGFAWVDSDGAVRVWEGTARTLARLPRPPGAGALCAAGTGLAVAAADGETWLVAEGTVRSIGSTVLAPVGALAALADGRIFASCGDGIAQWDCYEPSHGDWRALGAIVATLPTPRYGLAFADLAAGTQGELWLAEDDRGGCLWLYHPCWPAPMRTP